jgi:hypothetical protein
MSRLQRTKQNQKNPYTGWPSSSQFKPWNVCVKPTCWSKMAAWTSHGNCELWWPMQKTFEEDYSYLWYDDLWRIHNLGWNMPTKLWKLLSHWIISEETCTDTKPWKHYPLHMSIFVLLEESVWFGFGTWDLPFKKLQWSTYFQIGHFTTTGTKWGQHHPSKFKALHPSK